MKRIILTSSVFFLAALIGFGLAVLGVSNVQADPEECIHFPKGPVNWLSCITGPHCSGETPYYVFQCLGAYEFSGGLCDCTWIGCWVGSGC